MTAQLIVSADGNYRATGVGYAPEGEIQPVDGQPDANDLVPALQVGMLCNDSSLAHDEHGWHVVGDPTEGALLVLGAKAGLDVRQLGAQWRRLDSIPFESQNRYMVTHHRDPAGEGWILVKGAPERILSMCRWQLQDGAPESGMLAPPAPWVPSWALGPAARQPSERQSAFLLQIHRIGARIKGRDALAVATKEHEHQ